MAKHARAAAAPAVKIPRRPTPPDAIPRVIELAGPNDHLEIMTRAIFQSGLSWAMIAGRWDAFREAFAQFDVPTVATYGEFELERLMATDKLIHSAKKISGTFENARALVELGRRFGSIAGYVGNFASYADLYADAHERFAFMGDLNCYYWLFRTAQPVPRFEDWIARQAKDHPRMREMVVLARSAGSSSERSGF